MRWEHPQKGLISAGEFIAAVERSDLTRDLGNLVAGHAGRTSARPHTPNRPIEIAINLAARQLLHEDLSAVFES